MAKYRSMEPGSNTIITTQNADITSGYRAIEDGKQFERYFGQPEQRDRIIIEDGEVNETVDLMKKVVWKYLSDTKQIAAVLKANTVEKTAENIWNFLYHHIQYKLDKKGVEQLRRPNRSWSERRTGIDCDCFSIFVSSILTNLKIPHSFRIARYNEDYFQHVYVIIPSNTTKYITIDCVLSAFDFEKSFTEKRDFTMSLNGINVAVLSGISSPNVLDIIEGLEGLGSTLESDRLSALYNHLIKTREYIVAHPTSIMRVDDAKSFIRLLDYAIQSWNTPSREMALNALEDFENRFNLDKGLHNVEEYSDLEGVDTDWIEIEGLENHEIQRELRGLDGKTTKKKSKPVVKKKFFAKVKEAVKKGGKAFVRYNPVSVAARNGFLLAMKLNLKQMASKLKWGYASKEQAAAKGIKADQWQKSKNALSKIEQLFADKLQGKRDKLKAAILSGKAGGLNGVESSFDLEGLGVVVTATALAAAIPVIGLALKILVDSGLMSKKEAENLDAEVKEKAAAGEAELQDQNLFETPPTTKEAAISANKVILPSETSEEPSGEPVSEYLDTKESASTEENQIIGFAKRNPLIVAAGIAAGGLVLYKILKPTKNASKGMGSVRGFKKAKGKSKSKTKKSIKVKKHQKRKNIQVVRLS